MVLLSIISWFYISVQSTVLTTQWLLPTSHIRAFKGISAMIFKTSTSPLPSSASTQTRVNEDAEEAVNLCRESLKALPSQHPDMYLSYVRLQEIYLSRYQVQHNLTELSLAADNFRLASTPLTQAFPYRIITAWNWVTAAERQSYICARGLQQFRPYLAARSSTISRCEVAAAAFSCVISLPVDALS